MNRRDAIRQGALYIGGTAISASLTASILAGCKADPKVVWQPEALSVKQGDLLTRAIDLIIPTTDTPGAVDAAVPQMIDQFLVQKVLKKEESEQLVAGLDQINQDAQAQHNKNFVELGEADAFAMLQAYDEAAHGEKAEEDHFFSNLKYLTVFGYGNSELGATQHLNFLDIPQKYDACISLEEAGGVTWAM